MDTLNNKYKMRTPEETISIITNFFEERKFRIKFVNISQSEFGSWGITCKLYNYKYLILSSQGKGATLEFAKASALAEMYERFCNRMPLMFQRDMMNKIMEMNMEDFGYRWDPNEKLIDFNEIPEVFTNSIWDAIPYKFMPHYLSHYYIEDKKVLGIPFKDVFTETETIYIDPRLTYTSITSTGMSAGNALKEAMNQALSEWCERHTQNLFFHYPQEEYYLIPVESIKNEELRKKCEMLEEEGNKLFIFDLSRNYGMPVIHTLLVDKDNYIAFNGFGSFPVFDIALERTVSEYYQSKPNLRTKNIPLQIPYNNDFWYDVKKYPYGIIHCPIFLDDAFFKMKKMDGPSPIFLNEKVNNDEVFKYYEKLFKELNFNMYYRDNSLMDEIVAISIICTDAHPQPYFDYGMKTLTEKEKEDFYIFFNHVHNTKDMLFDKNKTGKEFEEEMMALREANKRVNGNSDLFTTYSIYQNTNRQFSPYGDSKAIFTYVFQMLADKRPLEEINNFLCPEELYFYKDIFKKYMTIINFNIYNKYTPEELLKLLNTVYDDQITMEDIEKCEDIGYVFEQCQKKLFAELEKEEFTDFINALRLKK